jgi:outer membrane protein
MISENGGWKKTGRRDIVFIIIFFRRRSYKLHVNLNRLHDPFYRFFPSHQLFSKKEYCIIAIRYRFTKNSRDTKGENVKSKINIFPALFILILLLYPTGFVLAQEKIGLKEAISLALKNDNRYLLVIEKENEYKAKVRESWGKLWPELGFSAAGTKWDADKGSYSSSDGQIDFRFLKGSFEINPGNFLNTLEIAQDSYTMSVHEERRIKSETTANIIRLYYQCILNNQIIALRSDSVKALEENLRVVTAKYKGGSLSQIDQLRASVSLTNEKTRLINAENDYQNTLSSLNVLIGNSIDSSLVIDNDSLSVHNDEVENVLLLASKSRGDKFAELVRIAVKNRPEIVQLSLKTDIAESGKKLDQSVYLWPTFYVNGNYGLSKVVGKEEQPATVPYAQLINKISDSLSPPDWNKSWAVTVGITYKWGALSPLDPSHAKTAQDESRKRQSEIETDDFIKSLNLEIQKGILKLISAAHAIESQQNNIVSAKEYFRIAVIQFKNGMIDNTMLLDANVELKNAQTLYYQALYDMQTAKSELNRAIGCDYFTIQ